MNTIEQLERENKELKAEIERLGTHKTATVSLSELFNEEIFGALPRYLTNLVGEGAASMILRESMRDATINVLKNNTALKERIDKAETFTEKFTQCYAIYEDLGFPFKYEITGDTDEVLTIKITVCPHIEYVKKNPVACNACSGIKLGILESLFGIRVPAMRRTSCMALGDDSCISEIPKKGSNAKISYNV